MQLQRNRSKAASFLAKFRWVVSDRTKLEAIIVHLKDCNDGLYHLLSATERRRLRRALPAELVTTNIAPQLAQLEEASQGNSALSNMAALRRFNLSLADPAAPSWAVCEELATVIPVTSIKGASVPGQVQEVATYCPEGPGAADRTVLLEWKNYGGDAKEDAQETRIRRLARVLERLTIAEGVCIPQCLGYTADHRNYRTCLVFKHPNGGGEQPETLYKLLGSKGVPPLGDRFKLALRLATSLSAIHTSGWLHKQLNSHNILFFSRSMDKRLDVWRISAPFIVGFEFSRPNESEAESELLTSNLNEQPYRHPSSQGPLRKRFCRAFDIYSLGVMLVEIGYWRPISQFIKDSSTSEKLLQDLIKFHVPRLAPKTGSIYAEVTRNCLGGILADPTLDETESQRRFYWSVVGDLERLVV